VTLLVPQYIKVSGIQDSAIRYQWDDWKRLPAAVAPDPEATDRLQQISQRAVLAFACGASEWIVCRFATLCNDPAPWHFIEAAWAMILDVRYSGFGSGTGWQSYAQKSWVGPVRGPINRALVRLECAFINLAREGHNDPTEYASRLSTLAAYLMTSPAAYKRWRGWVIGRLEQLYPRNLQDPIGDVVPREVIDPDSDFQVELTEHLINRFLSSLDHRSNIFLSSPEGMLEHFDGSADFKQTPYVFSMDADRKARRDKT
jgi:hypothetical protein